MVSLGSLDGVDPKVADALRQIASALVDVRTRLQHAEDRIPRGSAADTAARAALKTVEQQVQQLRQDVGRLTPEVNRLASPPPGVPGNPHTTPSDRLPLFDGSAIVAGVFAAHPELIPTSCQTSSGGNWDLMDALVDALRAADPRFAYNGKRGNPNDPSLDAVSYDYAATPGGEGSPTVYIVDIIAGHCGPNPAPAWNDVTVFAPGVWISRGRF